MKKITVKSYAKINLSIDVGKAQPNGFHDVDMIMQQIAFHDDVKISFTENSAPDAGAGSGTTFDTSPEGISNFRLNSPRIGFIFRQMKGIWHTEPLN